MDEDILIPQPWGPELPHCLSVTLMSSYEAAAQITFQTNFKYHNSF